MPTFDMKPVEVSQETLDALKETFGFASVPILYQYIDYIKHLFKGDFGISI